MSPASRASTGAGVTAPIGLRIAAGEVERHGIERDEAPEGVTNRRRLQALLGSELSDGAPWWA